ncbi:hypothetical protein ES319_D11G326600v1 [Gossypium barbadense]|uniref:Uncharacterized protein n=1 Tax=Gossypium barbadense TaxID=3634 RepID=A0A5J5PID8_GOSBA|nr:hypothetical protein ES319_D11G326600v1 [Gossypium barbadense]
MARAIKDLHGQSCICNFDDFKQAQADLHAKEVDIQQQLKDEHHFGKMPKLEVERWFKKVEEKLTHAQHVEDKVSKGKYLFRSCFGKIVDESTQAMKEVRAEGRFSGSLIVNDPSTIAVNLPTPELTGAADVREEFYQYLMGDEVGMIGVCGMGGIGKTTIMKDVHNRLLKESKFRKLIWVTVSQNFDIQRLQKNITCQLKGNLSDDEDTIIRAGKLWEMLKGQGSYVLILDDVWKSFSLEDVGILEPTSNNGCKLVLTTRSERVVRSMGFKKVQVPCLSMEEAMDLFLSKVGLDILADPTLESFLKIVVRECDGLPLAIVTLAGCMRGLTDPHVWENAIDELRGYIRNIHDVEDKVYGCLKFNYDRLKQRDQECFLYCALYREDYAIIKEELIEHCSGYSILQNLEENCLLERAERDSYNSHFIYKKTAHMHDVVRAMALHITRKRFMVKARMQLKELPKEEEWSEDLEKVSLMHNFISTIPQTIKFLKFPKLTTMLLSHNSLKEIPESFFQHFPNLMILDLSHNPFESLPESISTLEKLTALLLIGCYNLESLPSVLKLQALKKLDLEGSGVKEIPQDLEMPVNLRYLNLKGTLHLKEIPKGLLSKLWRLQFLAIHDMRELNKLEAFEGCFFNVGDLSKYAAQRKMLYKYSILEKVVLPYDIQQLNLKLCKGVRSLEDIGLRDATDLKECEVDCCDKLEAVFSSKCHQLQTLESLILISLRNLNVIVGAGVEESSVGTFSSLKVITLVKCEKIKKMFSVDWVLPNLENLTVSTCSKLKEIIAEPQKEGTGAFKFSLPKLKRLTLCSLPELKSICGENGVIVCDSLECIEIVREKVKRIPLYLPQLQIDDEGKPTPSNPLKEIRMHSTY